MMNPCKKAKCPTETGMKGGEGRGGEREREREDGEDGRRGKAGNWPADKRKETRAMDDEP